MMPGATSTTIIEQKDGKVASQWREEPEIYPHFWRVVAVYFVLTCIGILVAHLPTATDYVGKDNDDVMRLVEVRDLLAGQGWFDLMQYRLGLHGGTLMHWSRVIDLPIAALITFFGLFLPSENAEMMALAVWPMALVFPLLAAAGTAGRNMGGHVTVHVSLGMTALFALSSNRFLPGSIDHHNVQLVLVLTIAAMLVDRHYSAWRFAIAGAGCAFAIAIGAETIPLIAAACLCVAVTWAVVGTLYARAAQAFGLSLTLTISALFFLTVPSSSYSLVTCDSLSLGFYGLTTLGGTLLFLAARFASGLERASRCGVLVAIGIAVAATTIVLAPQCLGSPLASLDPLLVTLWLDSVIEARSVFAEGFYEPETLGSFYVPGLLAIMVCLYQIFRGKQVRQHATLLTLIGISWLIALVQVRGAAFANVLSIIPLALMVSQLRQRALAANVSPLASLAYIFLFLVSLPLGWLLMGNAYGGLANMISDTPQDVKKQATKEIDIESCKSKADFAQLAALDPALVATSVDIGANLLRYTHHRALSAPYHRNQGGMLTEIHIAISSPKEAEAFMRGEGVTILAFCSSDTGSINLMRVAPDGLYSQLAKGNVPHYLEQLPGNNLSGFQLFRLRPQAN